MPARTSRGCDARGRARHSMCGTDPRARLWHPSCNAFSFMTLDVERIRGDFPVLQQRVYGKPLVYLDSAATNQQPRVMIDLDRGALFVRVRTRREAGAMTLEPQPFRFHPSVPRRIRGRFRVGRRAGAGADQVMAVAVGCELRAGGDAEFGEDHAEVVADGGFGDGELFGDLFVGDAGAGDSGDLALARGELVDLELFDAGDVGGLGGFGEDGGQDGALEEHLAAAGAGHGVEQNRFASGFEDDG
jgi:hypothetical protein